MVPTGDSSLDASACPKAFFRCNHIRPEIIYPAKAANLLTRLDSLDTFVERAFEVPNEGFSKL